MSHSEKQIRPATLLFAGFALACAISWSGIAAAQEGQLLPPLMLDRLDENAVWRLSEYVPTNDGSTPSDPVPLYIQFGFLGCEPCEVLAGIANEELSTDVEKVYVHLDDVLLNAGYTNQRLWRELFEHVQEPPYDEFVPIRRGNTALMNALCGEDSNAPSGLLLLPSGEVFEVLRSPGPEAGRAAFRRFMAALER